MHHSPQQQSHRLAHHGLAHLSELTTVKLWLSGASLEAGLDEEAAAASVEAAGLTHDDPDVHQPTVLQALAQLLRLTRLFIEADEPLSSSGDHHPLLQGNTDQQQQQPSNPAHHAQFALHFVFSERTLLASLWPLPT